MKITSGGIILIAFMSSCAPELISELNIGNRVNTYVGDTTIKAEVAKMDIETDISKRYYWFENNTINSSQGSYSGKLLHGHYQSFSRESKNMIISGKFVNGLKHGSWLLWYPNGNLQAIQRYKKGKLHGSTIKYDAAGNPADTLRFKNGNLLVDKADTPGLVNRLKRLIKLNRND